MYLLEDLHQAQDDERRALLCRIHRALDSLAEHDTTDDPAVTALLDRCAYLCDLDDDELPDVLQAVEKLDMEILGRPV